MSPALQALDRFYGMPALDRRRFMVSGWRPNLPGFPDAPSGRAATKLLPALIMMAPFATALHPPWLCAGVARLESFVQGDGTHGFPASHPAERRGWLLALATHAPRRWPQRRPDPSPPVDLLVSQAAPALHERMVG